MSRSLVFVTLLAACHATLPPPPARDPVQIARSPRDLVERDLEGACRRYYKGGLADRRTVLACGKWQFFYETFGTTGVPSTLPRMLVRAFRDEVGAGFSRYGMIPDPRSPDDLPFGLVKGKLIGLTPSLAYTCASCHVARLPDGRIAIGAPNHLYEYGKQILAMTVFPFVATGSEKGHDPSAIEVIRPLLEHLKADPRIWASLGGSLMAAVGALKMPSLSPDQERAYASWPAGTQDFVMKPTPFDDHVEIVGKIPPLYDLVRDDALARADVVHAQYGWSGNAHSFTSFMHGFIELGGGDPKDWPEEKLRPLAEYVYSLRAPRNPSPAPTTEVAAGKALFAEKGCARCHDGPGHGGRHPYGFDEVGTDDALARWLDAEHEGKPCCGAKIEDPLTRKVKAPRLQALWLQHRFLHNGALSSLEQLFCLAERPERPAPLGTQGHRQTCDGLSRDDKHALIAFLKTL